MANHVVTNVTFHEINDAAKAKLAELFSRLRPTEKDRHYQWFGDLWVDGKKGSPTYEETEQYAWTVDNIGPKWCYVEEVGDDYFRTESAWSYPSDGIMWLLNQLAELDPNLIASATFEDECLNFFGYEVYDANSVYEYEELQHEDIVELVKQEHPELNEMWDEEEEDFTDEGRDLFYESVYEIVYNKSDDFITNEIEYLKEYRKEIEDES